MIELIIAFGAGLISFLSPCVLPLIPGYISYISGSSLDELVDKKNINLFPIILFTVGFSLVFITLMPGDVITTGTPAGVGMGMTPPDYLKDGDEMILKVDNLGEQKLKVVKEK